MTSSFGLATKARALPGKQEQLLDALGEVSRLVFNVPGCISYVVSTLPDEPDAVFITEFWESRQAHESIFAMAGVYEVVVQFQALTADIEQHELQPLAN
ncbi:MAG: antibiotic biosynthesis monooxygenase [Oxalobacteraceae bacterium]|nr:MAG: antibiotic biosynthesis monooxygenase [Oxalobacteraceae bacterium]